MRVLLIYKGAHEIASLSWSFCIKTKGRNQNQFRNFTSSGILSQHIKIISCHFNFYMVFSQIFTIFVNELYVS
jgi:hypothetical protein